MPSPLIRTYGAEIGIRNESIPKLVNTLSFWMLHSDSELIYTGDAGTTEPGAASMRQGIELSSYWRPEEWVMVDIEATLTDAHLVDTDPPNQKIPNSSPYTFNGGITLGGTQGFFGSLRARYFAPRPLDSVVDVKTRESLQVNARLGFRKNNWEIAMDCLNLLNRSDYDVAYYYTSQPNGLPAQDDVHVHPSSRACFAFR